MFAAWQRLSLRLARFPFLCQTRFVCPHGRWTVQRKLKLPFSLHYFSPARQSIMASRGRAESSLHLELVFSCQSVSRVQFLQYDFSAGPGQAKASELMHDYMFWPTCVQVGRSSSKQAEPEPGRQAQSQQAIQHDRHRNLLLSGTSAAYKITACSQEICNINCHIEVF